MKKIVNESIYNYMNFTQDGDPIDDMGIGARKLIENWLESQELEDHEYTINSDLSIDVYKTVELNFYEEESQLPDFVQFNDIRGGFHCIHNNLTSMRGFPRIIRGSLMCHHNKLKTLEGGPEIVLGSYSVSRNELESLKGIPRTINENLYINHNNLKSLKDCPTIIKGDMYINDNPIKTLEYFPQEIKGNLYYSLGKFLTASTILNKYKSRIKGRITQA